VGGQAVRENPCGEFPAHPAKFRGGDEARHEPDRVSGRSFRYARDSLGREFPLGRRRVHRGDQGHPRSAHGDHLWDISLQGVRGAVPEHADMDRRDEGVRTRQGQGDPEDVLLLHDVPQVREGVRQELRGDSGAGVSLDLRAAEREDRSRT